MSPLLQSDMLVYCIPSPWRHVNIWPIPRPWWLLPGGVQPLWPGSEATSVRKALRATTRPSCEAVRPTALSHLCTPAPAEGPPRTFPFPWDKCFFRFILGRSRPGGRQASGGPTFAFHSAPAQTLQELQGWSTVRTEWREFVGPLM